MAFELRPYQRAAVEGIFSAWEECRRTLLVLPTGTGKTVVFSKVAERVCQDGGPKKALILAHREELLQQAQDKIRQSTGLLCAFERRGESAIDAMAPITCASVQTLMRESRLSRYSQNHYDTVIVDEAHHALSDSYQRILGYFSGARVLGVTATPDRGDKRSLGTFFERIAFEYSIRDAIKDGYLSPIVVQTVPLAIDIKGVGVCAGDFSADDLGCAIDPYLEQIASCIPKDRKTLIFLPLIDTSRRMTEFLKALGHRAEHIDGNSHDRAAILARFQSGECSVLCNSMLLTEGFDDPGIDCVVCLRPTKVRSLYAQIVGRGTRLAPRKKDLLILDFLWQTAKHDLCHAGHLITDKAETAQKMRTLAEGGGCFDLEELEAQAESSTRAERENALAQEIRRNASKKGRTIDPLEYALSLHAYDLEEYTPVMPWEHQKPTEKQLLTLGRMGFDTRRVDNRGMASLLLNKVFARSNARLSTPKQIRLLESFGHKEAMHYSFEQASQFINAIAANGWRRVG